MISDEQPEPFRIPSRGTAFTTNVLHSHAIPEAVCVACVLSDLQAENTALHARLDSLAELAKQRQKYGEEMEYVASKHRAQRDALVDALPVAIGDLAEIGASIERCRERLATLGGGRERA